MMQIRQGDILLAAIDAPQQQPVMHDRPGPLLLARGEATGHAHMVHGPAVRASWHDGAAPDGAVIELPEPAQLQHEEHAWVDLEPGWYEVIRQREYTPAAPRMVAD
jgi:hypothetical protein